MDDSFVGLQVNTLSNNDMKVNWSSWVLEQNGCQKCRVQKQLIRVPTIICEILRQFESLKYCQ